MFPPDADASPYHPPPQSKEAERNPKIVKHANTRLPEQDEDTLGRRSLSQPPSPTRSRIDAAITGTPCKPEVLQSLAISLYFDRSSATPEREQLLARARPTFAHPSRTWFESRETVDDMGNNHLHPSHYWQIRRHYRTSNSVSHS